MKLLKESITSRLAGLDGWSFQQDAIVREFKFPAFPDAVAFIARLGFSAEAADHHPDLVVNYRKVRVAWSTHDEGGVTEKDFAGAAESDRIAKQLGA
jgi:4a-hydroxytetrahydrobiopterin dehydratase